MDNGTKAILVGVAATFALDVYSTLNSSPQTTELFAGDREDTLMHWVTIGGVVAVGGGGIMSVIDGSWWPVLAAAAVAGGMYLMYVHAVQRGQDKPPPENSWGS